ncbi:Ubiquitin conjugation factor E4 [Vanrija pseudolonga]|uniref:RING-type E3 ubiquitin transferase n=1 Tax=Vanrija pseudolonga TaxID=143232 RepID=A0AAF0Y876_9TREE|nr:Ubiquitin conjugation factor E4 [Vanrija pseudolonga]
MSGNDPNLSEAEKMRLKRLARLGAPAQTQPQPQATDAPSTSQESREAHQPPSASSRLLSLNTSSSSQPSPSAAPPPKPPVAKPATPPVKPTPPPSAPPVKRRFQASSSPAPSAPPRTAPASNLVAPTLSYDAWEARTVRNVFSVTLKRSEAEASNWKLCWLKDLEGEIKEENPGNPAALNVNLALRDRLLIARLSLDPSTMATSDDPDQLTVLAGLPQDETVFEYLTGAWKRLYTANREFNRLQYSKEEKAKWVAAFDELKRLIISYSGMTLEDPTMFPQPPSRPVGPAEFLPLLLGVTAPSSGNSDPLSSSTVVAQSKGALAQSDLVPFLNDLAAGFADGSMADVITPTLSLFFQEWFKITPTPDLLGNDWRNYLGAVSLLVQVKPIAALLPSLPVWVAPSVTAAKVEWQSLLGPLTRLSVFPREFPEIWKEYFSNPTDRQTADIDANKANLRHSLEYLQTSLFSIYNSIIRASPESREGALDFFALIVKLNAKRQGMQVDHRSVSSDGFMTNLQAVLLKLFEPVMDIQFSKIDKVDPEYYRHSKRIDITDETKIKATKEEADEFYGAAMDLDSKPNFISDLFFLLNAVHHLGLGKTVATRVKAERNISDMEKDLKHLESKREEWAGNPAMQAQGEAQIAKVKSDIATLHASLHAYDTQLLDPRLTRLNVTYCGFLMTWLLRMADPKHQHPQVPIALPLPAEVPLQFRMLPEYLFDNVVEYYDFLAHHDPDALDNADKDILITFVLTFLAPGYVNNPFLKAKMVSILSNGLYPAGYHRRGPMFDRLSVHPVSIQYLMPALIRFFIDVEMTGGHTQFWDKFSFRRDISHIIKAMWSNPLHREAFVKARHDDFDMFIKFVNMLMSDTTFHLEESLTNLTKINSLRAQKADEASWSRLEEAERNDLDSQLRQAESSAPFHTQEGRNCVELIRDFTDTTKEPFLVGEIVDRLAASLDENLVNLVGPKMQDLKVADPDRFSFKPKPLLAAIAQIYLNLGHEADFIRAVANDQRSYTPELFERFARVLKNRAIMTAAEVDAIVSFSNRVKDAKATIEIEDEREIPDEFLDPLLATLMKDPVILPVSRVTVDRSTIRAVLLSKDLDPFNNVPLKYEDVIPDVELKAKIDAWIAEGSVPAQGSAMDVDA